MKNIIQPGITGQLCRPGNVQDFTIRILQLINHDSLRFQMGMEGRNYALGQKWDLIFENLLMSYTEALSTNDEQKFA